MNQDMHIRKIYVIRISRPHFNMTVTIHGYNLLHLLKRLKYSIFDPTKPIYSGSIFASYPNIPRQSSHGIPKRYLLMAVTDL